MQQTKAQKAADHATAAVTELQLTVQHVMRVLAVYADNYATVYYSEQHKKTAAAAIVLAEYAKNAAALLATYADDVISSDTYRDYKTE
jgi:hypothetical protein